MNQENREINLRVERVLIDYDKHLSRATDELGWHCFFFAFFLRRNYRLVVAQKLFPLCISLQHGCVASEN